MFSKRLLIALVLAMLALAGPASAQTIPRIDQDFVQWTAIVIDGNHPEGSNAYEDLDDLGLAAAAFEAAAEAFLAEDWSGASTLADAIDYDVAAFRDTATGETYYGLLPEADNGDGRGFFFIRPRAGVQRRLVLQAAHAVEDNRTGVLGSEIFRASGARALLLSGADRCASEEESGCTGDTDCGDHRVSDAAHSVDTFFHIFHELASTEHADTLTLQIHGFKADGTDPEFSVSDGTETKNASNSYLPNAFYLDLQGRMAAVNPGLTRNGNSCNSSLTGQGEFKCGTQNVQGRHLNGSPEACGTAASSASGRFVHLEMSNDLREPGNLYSQQLVIDAVNAVFPRTASAGDLVWADLNSDGARQSNERGIHGVTVEVLDAGDAVVESTTSVVGAYRIGNLAPGTYRLRVQLPSGYSAGTGLGSNGRALTTFTVTAGQSLTDRDLALIPPAVGEVGDLVWKDTNGDGLQGETGLQGVSVRLLTADDRVVATQSTGAGGAYAFDDVLPGDYKLSVDPGAGRGFTRQVAGSPSSDSDVDPLTGRSAAFNLAAGATDSGRDAGLYEPCLSLALLPDGHPWIYKTGTASWPADWNTLNPASTTLAGWTEGLSPFGFGDLNGLDYATEIVNPVETGTGTIFTTYFRGSFEVNDPTLFQEPLQLTFSRNDGVAIYLNGIEVVRRNLPWGTATRPDMPASTEATATETLTIPPSLLLSGTNVIAVELHEERPDPEDDGEPEGFMGLSLTGRVCSCRVRQSEITSTQGTFLKPGSTPRGSRSLIEMDGGTGVKSGLIRFDLSTLPSGSEILEAALVVYVDSASGSSSNDPYAIHALKRSWSESTATWTDPWDEDGAVGDDDSSEEKLGLMPIDPGTNVEASAPLNAAGRNVVQGWLDTPATNFGFLIDAEEGTEDGLDIRSDESANPPRLRVLYIAPSCP